MRRIVPVLFLILLCHGAAAAPECTFDPARLPPATAMKRGINLSGWWQVYRWPRPDPEDFLKLRRTGIDFVRLPVSEEWLEDEDDLQAVRCSVVELLQAGLRVIVDLHPGGSFDHDFSELPEDEAAHQLKTLWQHLGGALKDLPHERVLFQIYNEPHMEPRAWWRVQGEVIRDLRDKFPKHRFVVMASLRDENTTLANMKPYPDPNLIYDFHFYVPMYFTHNGVSWLRGHDWEKVTYPATADDEAESEEAQKYNAYGWNRAKLSKFLEPARWWKKRYGKQVMCLEFGVHGRRIDAQSRATWLRDTRVMLEAAGIPWAVWEYRGDFGLFNADTEIDPAMAKALGLRHSE